MALLRASSSQVVDSHLLVRLRRLRGHTVSEIVDYLTRLTLKE